MKQETRNLWVERLGRWAASGLDANEFAAREGISARTLQNGKWRLGAEKNGRRVLGRAGPTPTPMDFVEVSKPIAVDVIAAAPFEVSLRSGARIVVPARFEVGSFRDLVAALGGS